MSWVDDFNRGEDQSYTENDCGLCGQRIRHGSRCYRCHPCEAAQDRPIKLGWYGAGWKWGQGKSLPLHEVGPFETEGEAIKGMDSAGLGNYPGYRFGRFTYRRPWTER